MLIWLAAFAGTGCIGFLLATFLATIKEADAQMAKKQPPAPPQKTPWWKWLIMPVTFLFLNKIPTSLSWACMIVAYSVFAVMLLRSVIIGWRTQRDAHFCAKAAAACAGIAASSGFVLWRFN